MKSKIFWVALLIFGFLMKPTTTRCAPVMDALLTQEVNNAPISLTPVVITYDHQPTTGDVATLKWLGITGGVTLIQLPMVLTVVNQAQLNALESQSGIVSLYANRTLSLLDNASDQFIGVLDLWDDADVTARNQGMPVSGKGVGIAYVDTGIDATHPDLQLGQNVIQNVLFPFGEIPLNLPSGFVPPAPIENLPFTDAEGGHGTFGAAIAAGTGQASGGFYEGVAPGAHLIGLVAGNDEGLSTFAILEAYDYALVHQVQYNIRVCNNSFGTTLARVPYSPDDPINVATRMMHDRNMTVVFAAGNSGDTPGAINPYSVAPWVISVVAGENGALGQPASFSSRGEDNGNGTDTAGQPADPSAPPDLRPDITAPGVNIKSARSKGPGVTNVAGTVPVFVGANDLTTIPPAFLPFYTTSNGTSFATPHVTGVVALMMEANPLLTPDQVVTILRQTAMPMPYPERVVGAGYLDAHNAVRVAMSLATVTPPENLIPQSGDPQIIDPANDQFGTTAQDIRTGGFVYDANSHQLVYTLTLTDLSTQEPENVWTMKSDFGSTSVYVSATLTETGTPSFQYGTITTLPDGTSNQQSLGSPDSGVVNENSIIVRLSLDKINQAVGFNVLYTISKNTEADTWEQIGTSLTGGLLLNSDTAQGSDFQVGTPPPPPSTTSKPQRLNEHFAGTLSPSQESVDVPVSIREPYLDAELNDRPRDQALTFQLIDSAGNVVATASSSDDDAEIRMSGLTPGRYRYRVSGSVSQTVDFVIQSRQSSHPMKGE